MRVISGSAKGYGLKTPKGNNTRPTQDRIKETLFNIIQFDIPGCVFIDLFCGSGGIGIEALSRGASHAYFIDNSKEAITLLKENLSHVKLTDKASVFSGDVFACIRNINEKNVGVIFCDPPYQFGKYELLVESLSKMNYINEDTTIIIEAELKKDFSFVYDLGFEITREKSYKNNKHVFLRKGDKS